MCDFVSPGGPATPPRGAEARLAQLRPLPSRPERAEGRTFSSMTASVVWPSSHRPTAPLWPAALSLCTRGRATDGTGVASREPLVGMRPRILHTCDIMQG